MFVIFFLLFLVYKVLPALSITWECLYIFLEYEFWHKNYANKFNLLQNKHEQIKLAMLLLASLKFILRQTMFARIFVSIYSILFLPFLLEFLFFNEL